MPVRPFITLLPCVLLFAIQAASVRAGLADPPERFRHITTEQGLSQGTVYAFCQDAQGFLWMGTQDGLNRWDGHAMKVWKHDPWDPFSISQGYIRALLADEQDHLWIGTEGGGLDRLDLRTGLVKRFTLPTADGAATPASVFCLARTAAGVLLVGGPNGLFVLDPSSGTFRSVDHGANAQNDPDERFVQTLLVDAADGIWLGTKGGLFHLPSLTANARHFQYDAGLSDGLPKNNIKALFQDAEGHVWVGTYGGGLCRWVSGTDRFEPFVRSDIDFVYGITEDRYGKLWVASFNGLHVLDQQRRALTTYRQDANDPHALKSDLTLAIYCDGSGLIWVSSSGKGASLTDPAPDRFHVLDDRSGPIRLSESFVYGIAATARGTLLIATAGGGLHMWDRAANSMHTLRHMPGRGDGISSDVVRCALEDSKGRLWIGTDKSGLDRLDVNGRSLNYQHRADDPRSLPGNVILTLFEDRNGTIWAGTYNKGLARYNEDTDDFTAFVHEPGNAASLPGNIIRCILQDRTGALWIGTGGSGLCRMDPSTGTFRTYRVSAQRAGSLTSNFIRALHETSNGDLWVGTNGGGLCLAQRHADGEFHFVPFTQREGMADNVVYAIAEASGGSLWLSTNKGLTEFHAQRVHAALPDRLAQLGPDLFEHHIADRGIQTGEFNGGASYRDPRGWVYFGGVNGLTYFHPDSMVHGPVLPEVRITDLQIRYRSVGIDTTAIPGHIRSVGDHYLMDRLPNYIDTLVIPHSASLFSIAFSAMDLEHPKDLNYHYILEGADVEWNDIGARRFISFTNLDPGRYVLRLAVSRPGLKAKAADRVVHIIIAPPFWMTGWFRGSVLLLLGLGTVMVVRRRDRRLRRENARMQQLVEDRTQQLSEQKLLVESRNSQLEDLNALNRRILSVISHDFKGPLISMRLLIDVLRDGRYERLDLHTSDIRNQLVQSELILQNLLDWARLELGEVQRPQPGTGSSAHAVVSSILAELQPMMKEKALTPLVALPVEQQVPVPLDALRIVYRNLISNALKYSPSGGTITCGFLPGSTEFFVQDEGSGIAPALAERLFKGAVHAELGTHHEKGFGLGLYLTAELIADLGGTIRVETSATGSRFLFTFTPPK